MFGLDARIALAIFGALSVISGAALYSAIENAKVTSIYTTLNEVIKAYESLYIDTGVLPKKSYDVFNPDALLEDKGDSGWNGPYMSGSVVEDIPSHFSLEGIGLPSGYYPRARWMKDVSWDPATADWSTEMKCSSGDVCSLWIQLIFTGLDATLAEAMDVRFDDGVASTGNIRYWSNRYIYIKGISLGLNS